MKRNFGLRQTVEDAREEGRVLFALIVAVLGSALLWAIIAKVMQ